MKKILALLLTFVLCFAFCGCVTTQGSEHESKNESEPLVEMQEIQPAGTVNLSEELDLFSKILDNNYINVDATGCYFDQEFRFELNAKRTEKGYDAIITNTRDNYVEKFYLVDGVAVRETSIDGGNYTYMYFGEYTFVDFIGALNMVINSQTDTKLVYHVLKPLIHKFKGFENKSYSKDFKDDYEGVVASLEKYRSRSVYEFVLEGMLGIDSTNEETTSKLRADILEFCSGNPSIAVFIDKIEAYINTKLDEENKIDIKAYLNDLQQNSGITTQEFVELFKEKIPAISDNLRVAEDGETLYAYIRSYLRTISLNMFTKNVIGQDATFVDFVDGLLESSKNITVEYAYNWIISHTLIKSQDSDGNLIIGDHLANYLASQRVCNKLLAGYKVEVDGNGRPTKIDASFNYSFTSGTDYRLTEDGEFFISAALDYSNKNVKIALPDGWERPESA